MHERCTLTQILSGARLTFDLRLRVQALREGLFADARHLQQDAVQAFTRALAIAKWYDALWDLDERIAIAEKLSQEAEIANNTPPPAYWTVSQHLNLTKDQVQAVEGWVGRPLQPEKTLYLASKHGFSSRAFHHRCDNMGPTVTLVRTVTGHIFGGYAAVSWSRGRLETKPPRWTPDFVDDAEVHARGG